MVNRIFNNLIKSKSILTTKERDFIATFAIGFIDSYRMGNKVVVDEVEEYEEDLTEEINICRKLIEKFGTNERKEYLNFEITKEGSIWDKLFKNGGKHYEKN